MKSTFKKFVSMLTAIVLSLGAITTSFAFVATDVAKTEYEDAAKVLGALNIMVGDAGTGMFRPKDAIKRSEVTKIAVALKNLANLANSSNSISKFPDVSKEHWASGYINVGTNENLIIGDDNGNFRPDDTVTYAEAVTILVRALGYEKQAQSKGGFPAGYLVTGSSIGLTRGVHCETNQFVARGDVATLAYNALTIKTMEQINYGSDQKYEVTDKTLLADYLGVDLIQGKVSAVGKATIDGNEVEKGKIKIGGKIYNCKNADVRNVLGFNVDAYITNSKYNGKSGELLVAIATDGENNVIDIPADNIHSINTESSNKTVIYYLQEGSAKTGTAKIDNSSEIIYNGLLGSWEDLKEIESGSIVLLDTNKDKNYDIIFVNETVNYVVDEVLKSSHRITDKYNMPTLTLDSEDDDMSYIIEKDGKHIDIDALEEWDVVTFTISKDKSLIYGETVRNEVAGTISEIGDDKVFIDGKGYKIAANYPNKLSIDDDGTFYLDINGKIAAYSKDSKVSTNYAYITNLGIKSGLNKVLSIELFNKDGEIVKYDASSKIRVNDSSALTAQKALDAIGGANQLVTYELNANNEISKITTAKKSSEIDEDIFALNIEHNGAVYNSKTGELVTDKIKIKVNNATLIFDINDNAESAEDYSVRDKSFFVDGGLYDIKVYNLKENLSASVIVVTDSDGKTADESAIAVVDKISTSKDTNGNTIEKLYAYHNGEYVTLSTTKTGLLKKGSSKLENGDIIQISTNAAGKIDGVTVLFDINKADKEMSEQITSNMLVEYGKVTKKFANSFNFSVNDGSIKNYEFSNAKIYVVDTSKNTNRISVGSPDNISKFDDANPERVFVRIFKDEVKDIVVIK